jgi:hypothetical protein
MAAVKKSTTSVGIYTTDQNHMVEISYNASGFPMALCISCAELAVRAGPNVAVKTADMSVWEWLREMNAFQDKHGRILLDGGPLAKGQS